jgi:MFS family permease
MLFLAPRAGKLYDRIGPRALVAGGTFLVGAGLIWDAAVLDKVSYGWLVPGYLAIGIGLSIVMTPASTDCMNTALPALRGEASGVMQTVRQVGGTVGLAIMGTIIAGAQGDHPAPEAFTSGVSDAYYVAGAMLLGAALVALAVLRHVRASDEAPGAARVPLATPVHAAAHPMRDEALKTASAG